MKQSIMLFLGLLFIATDLHASENMMIMSYCATVFCGYKVFKKRHDHRLLQDYYEHYVNEMSDEIREYIDEFENFKESKKKIPTQEILGWFKKKYGLLSEENERVLIDEVNKIVIQKNKIARRHGASTSNITSLNRSIENGIGKISDLYMTKKINALKEEEFSYFIMTITSGISFGLHTFYKIMSWESKENANNT